MAKYAPTSPYANTPQFSDRLDIYSPRTFDFDQDDIEYQIDSFYENRPDLLSFDLYGTPKLWWVFAVRNPDVIKDPVYDFVAGTVIRIPKQDNLTTGLGV